MQLDYDDRNYEIELADDGSLDTLISVDSILYRIDQFHAADYRDKDGFMSEDNLRLMVMGLIDSNVIS